MIIIRCPNRDGFCSINQNAAFRNVGINELILFIYVLGISLNMCLIIAQFTEHIMRQIMLHRGLPIIFYSAG